MYDKFGNKSHENNRRSAYKDLFLRKSKENLFSEVNISLFLLDKE